jgi:zinc transport system substrate-binding protein
VVGTLVLGAALGLVTAAGASVTRAGPRTDVVAAFYPLAFAAKQVGGKYVQVANLTPPGVEPHDLELTTDQVDALQDAGLVVVMGKGFQPAVEQVADDRDGPTLEVLDALRTRGGQAQDPHVWLDPVLMGRVVDEVAGALGEAVPAHAEAFAANAARLHAELDVLDADYRTGLADCTRDLVVTAHEAFGHLAARYGLRQEGVTGIAPDAEPSAKRLAKLSDLATREGVTTIFTEELVSPKVAETLAREAGGLRTAVLNPLEGLTDREIERGDDYFAVMRANLRKIRRALGCTSS